MATALGWTIHDLILFPEHDGNRYEIIDGALCVTTQPDWQHQYVSGEIAALLNLLSGEGRRGLALVAPGVVFAPDQAVAPDVVWVRRERYAAVLAEDGRLHAAPDLVVEVLSPGARNEQRDREAKLSLYSRRGVQEYWIVYWRRRQVEVYRRQDAQLHAVATLFAPDLLCPPLLPGFESPLERLSAPLADVGTGGAPEESA